MAVAEDIRVLIAEDDFLVSKMVKGVLQEIGYIIIGEAVDGPEAVEMTQNLSPDVVIMDIEMPWLNGLEATQRINELCPTPVVILSAYDTPDLTAQAGKAGAGAYLVKPPQARAIERAITIAMARFDDMNELRRLNTELQQALAEIKTLRGVIPICANCKKIRSDTGYWQQVEVYIKQHSNAEFTHGICPGCIKSLYPDYYNDLDNEAW